MPRCNSEAMSMHLEEIAFHVAPGAHAVLLLDQAGWHGSAELVVPPNITLMPLPPRCPELNPVENVWQFMRDNWLSNRIFQSYDDIVDHRSDEHTSELQSLMRISYAVFCLKKKTTIRKKPKRRLDHIHKLILLDTISYVL